jgi:hypothetical protein
MRIALPMIFMTQRYMKIMLLRCAITLVGESLTITL